MVGTKVQSVQRYSRYEGIVGTKVTVGTKVQSVQRYSRYKGTVGTVGTVKCIVGYDERPKWVDRVMCKDDPKHAGDMEWCRNFYVCEGCLCMRVYVLSVCVCVLLISDMYSLECVCVCVFAHALVRMCLLTCKLTACTPCRPKARPRCTWIAHLHPLLRHCPAHTHTHIHTYTHKHKRRNSCTAS